MKIEDWKKGALDMITKAFVPHKQKSSLLGRYKYSTKLLRTARVASRSSILGTAKYSRSCGVDKNEKGIKIYSDHK